MLFVRDYLKDQRVHRREDAPGRPLVSVILPTYSRCRSGLLKRAIDSVLSQTVADFELLVMDDGSRDGSADLIARYVEADARVIHVRHERNSGLPALRVNEGIALGRGRYIAFQFDDDEWRPEALATLTAAAGRHGDRALIIGSALWHRRDGTQRLPHIDPTFANLSRDNCIANNAVMAPRAFFDRFGMYDCHIAIRGLCDYDLWLRVIKHAPFVVLPDIVAEVHAQQEASLELTVANDIQIFRSINGIPRDHLLTPSRWEDYEVDSLQIGGVALPAARRRRMYEEQIVPYYLRMRHHFPAIDRFPAWCPDRPPRDATLYTEDRYAGPLLLMDGLDALSSRRGAFKVHHQHPLQVNLEQVRADSDAVLLDRLDGPVAELIARDVRVSGRPVAYLLADDMPPGRSLPAGLVAEADAVWASDEALARSAHAFNRRTIPHAGGIEADWLPDHPSRREAGRPLRVGVAVGVEADRPDFLREALDRISEEFGDGVELVGLSCDDATKEGRSASTYHDHLRRLREARLDLLLAPSPARPSGPGAGPYHEAAIAGALGIFSGVPANASLPGETCLKADDTAEGWAEALRRAIAMPADEFDRMRSACLAHAREAHTTAALIDHYEAAWRATEFHQLTRDSRGHDGRPRVAFVLTSTDIEGVEAPMWRRLELSRSYGVRPILVLPRSAMGAEMLAATRAAADALGVPVAFASYSAAVEAGGSRPDTDDGGPDGLAAVLRDLGPALVHASTLLADVTRACRELGIPHVASLSGPGGPLDPAAVAVDPLAPWCDVIQSEGIHDARRWRARMGVESACARPPVPGPFFDLGRRRLAPAPSGEGTVPRRPLRVVLPAGPGPRAGRLAAIGAVGDLRRGGMEIELSVFGCTNIDLSYFRRFSDAGDHGEGGAVRFLGPDRDVAMALGEADVLLCDALPGSLPAALGEAMAAGVLVVSTPAGFASELIVDGISGILCAGSSDFDFREGLRRVARLSAEDWARLTSQARRVALAEFHPHRAAHDLFAAYTQAIRDRRESAPSGAAAPRSSHSQRRPWGPPASPIGPGAPRARLFGLPGRERSDDGPGPEGSFVARLLHEP